MPSMDTIAKAIRTEIAELDKRRSRLERALALVDPEGENTAPATAQVAAKPRKRGPGRPKKGEPTARERVLNYLSENPEGVNQADFHNQLGLATATVAGLMKDMESKGQIQRSTFQLEGDKKQRRFVKLVSA